MEITNNLDADEDFPFEYHETAAQQSGLLNLLGIEILCSHKNHVEMRMPISPNLYQPHGFLHGGATLALLESAASAGAVYNADLSKELPFGIDVQVRHRKSGKAGYLRGVADLDKVEGNKWFWKVVAYDDEGDVISDGVIMVKIVSFERLAEKERERKAAKQARHL